MNSSHIADASYRYMSLFILFTTITLGLYVTFADFAFNEFPSPLNSMGTGALSLVPGCLSIMPFLAHLSPTHRITWAGGGLIALVATGLLTITLVETSQAWIFYFGPAFAQLALIFTIWVGERSAATQRKFLLTVRIVGALLMIGLACIIATASATIGDSLDLTALITPAIIVAVAVCFACGLKIQRFPVGDVLTIALGLIPVISMMVILSGLLAGFWTIGIGFMTLGMAALTLNIMIHAATSPIAKPHNHHPTPETL